MKNLNKILFSLFAVVGAIHTGYGQVEGTMPFMQSLPQVTYYNPAFKPLYKFSIGLPGSSVSMQLMNNGFTYNDAITVEGGVRTLDIVQFNNALRKKNYINTNLQADLFRISLKVNPRLYLTFNTTSKVYSRLMFPKDLFGILTNGNAQFINGTATISPEVEMLAYTEIATGASYTVNRDLTVGARFKLLKGIVNATTQHAAVNLSVSDEYAMTVSAAADIRTSGIYNFTSEDSEFDAAEDWRDFTNNNGFAVDLGATYRLQDRITVGLSLIDIGGIRWKNDTYGYTIDSERAEYTFEGVDLNEILNGNDEYTESIADTLEARFKLQEGRIGSYRSPLPGKMYLTGVYKIRNNFSAGALIFAEKFRGRFMPGFTASLNKEFGRRVGTSLSYTITNNSFNNLGAGVSFNFVPVQFYIVGDNILRAPFALAAGKSVNDYINSLQYFNLRVGLNFVFGREKSQEKLPTPKN